MATDPASSQPEMMAHTASAGRAETDALRDEPITLYGEADQTRSYCYVNDMISAFVGFIESAPVSYQVSACPGCSRRRSREA